MKNEEKIKEFFKKILNNFHVGIYIIKYILLKLMFI